MKLLIVTQTLDMNDPILGFFHRWVEEFAKRFETVTVIALNVGTYRLPAHVSVRTLGKELGMERTSRVLRYLALLISLRREYTHVFAHMNPEYVIGGGPLWRLLGKKVGFWYVHGSVSWRLKFAAFFAHKVFTASKESCRIANSNVVVVGHGIDIDSFAPSGEMHPPSIISIGRFSPSKRLETVIGACAVLKKSFPNLKASLVGNAGAPEDEGYALRISELAKNAGVVMLPPVPHAGIPAILQGADVFLNASTTGSLDKAVLEAMSMGIVPVTSNVAFKPILESMGLFVENTPEAFAERTRQILGDAKLKAGLAERVRKEIVEHHSLGRLMDVLKKTYATL